MPEHASIKQRLRSEIRTYLGISVYLFVCLGAIALYKDAVLRDADVGGFTYGVAAVKSLILAKFLMLGEIARVGKRRSARSMLHRIAWRAVLLALLLLALTVVEELAVGAVHGRSMSGTLAEFGARLPEVLALTFLMLLILLPLIAAQEIDEHLGRGALTRLLLSPGESPGGTETHDRPVR